ncbi:glycosyltransferase [Prochlorococcus marinus]|uniref:glycosyltransferase n=1 Tax=Prochlorococcus marinus TaxID=1219 RepID=UPI0032AEF2E1|nr:hypothetical protein [Prochlorococcus marinus str. MU1416]
MRYFCTLFDKNYLIKGLSMINSLSKNCIKYFIYVLCLDKETKDILDKINLNNVKTILLNEIEDRDLLEAKSKRTNTEYCWTLASSFTWYVLNRFKQIDLITYLDADLLFYSDVEVIFKEIKKSSIAIIEHRFSSPFEYLEVNGRFCVEWNSFRRDKEGIRCLDNWRKQCLAWCYYRLENGKMGDQKYLDEWPSKFRNCHIIKDDGAGIAPWNYAKYEIKKQNNKIKINESNLIFYHFHQFKILENQRFFRLGDMYSSNKKEPDLIYEIYEKEILKSLNIIRKIDKKFNHGIFTRKNYFFKDKIKKLIPNTIKKIIRRII